MPQSTESFIAGFYDQATRQEWERHLRHRTEFALTLRRLKAHLPPPPLRVLDCGGGPGRYAIWLAELGYEVTLFDLSAGNLEWARRQAGAAGVTLAAYEQGTALDLSRFPQASFDAVLLMGPLYHLLEDSERRRAIAEARRVLRSGGFLFASFLTRYAAHRDAAAKYPENVLTQREIYDRILTAGRSDPPTGELEGFVAYFAHPDEIIPRLWEAGLEVRRVFALEGVASLIEDKLNALEGEAWERWVEINEVISVDPDMRGASEHLLAVTVNPGWRAVLKRVAVALEQAGLTYTIAGGTSVALHGVPQAVKDIDIELPAADAYRFQELFPAEVLGPVSWKEGEAYRSHFGQFEIDGVKLDVMGDLQRRQGEAWVNSFTVHREPVDLDGHPVWASWLEEETLANLRRGRLERAALCLPRCDPQRLSGLLTGAIETGVI